MAPSWMEPSSRPSTLPLPTLLALLLLVASALSNHRDWEGYKDAPTTHVARPEGCSLPLHLGRPCDPPFENPFRRFYFDTSTASCHHFWYTGCGGNRNHFLSRSTCNTMCASNATWSSTMTSPTMSSNTSSFCSGSERASTLTLNFYTDWVEPLYEEAVKVADSVCPQSTNTSRHRRDVTTGVEEEDVYTRVGGHLDSCPLCLNLAKSVKKMTEASHYLVKNVVLKICSESSASSIDACQAYGNGFLLPLKEIAETLIDEDVLCKLVFPACVATDEKSKYMLFKGDGSRAVPSCPLCEETAARLEKLVQFGLTSSQSLVGFLCTPGSQVTNTDTKTFCSIKWRGFEAIATGFLSYLSPANRAASCRDMGCWTPPNPPPSQCMRNGAWVECAREAICEVSGGADVACDPNQGQLTGKSCLSKGEVKSCVNIWCLPPSPGRHFPCFSSTTTTTTTTTTAAPAPAAGPIVQQPLQCLMHGAPDHSVNWVYCRSIVCVIDTQNHGCVSAAGKFKSDRCQLLAGGAYATCNGGIFCVQSSSPTLIQCATGP